MKCPNCGSTAQVYIYDHEFFVWQDTVSIYLMYKCGCDYQFVTKMTADRSEEKLFGEIVKKPTLCYSKKRNKKF